MKRTSCAVPRAVRDFPPLNGTVISISRLRSAFWVLAFFGFLAAAAKLSSPESSLASLSVDVAFFFLLLLIYSGRASSSLGLVTTAARTSTSPSLPGVLWRGSRRDPRPRLQFDQTPLATLLSARAGTAWFSPLCPILPELKLKTFDRSYIQFL